MGFQPRSGGLLGWQSCQTSLLELSGENRAISARQGLIRCVPKSLFFSPYFSSMAVLNFSTFSSLRSWAASLPVLSSRNTVCLQSSLALGRFVRSGSSNDWHKKKIKIWSSSFITAYINVIPLNYVRFNYSNNIKIPSGQKLNLKQSFKRGR